MQTARNQNACGARTSNGREVTSRSAWPFEVMHRVFGEPVLRELQERATHPLELDIVDEEGALVVTASLPGYSKEDVSIDLEDGVLTITGTHSEEKIEENEDVRYLRRERRVGTVSRKLRLPEGIDEGAAEAELSNGVLHLRLPKVKAPLPTKIAIK